MTSAPQVSTRHLRSLRAPNHIPWMWLEVCLRRWWRVSRSPLHGWSVGSTWRMPTGSVQYRRAHRIFPTLLLGTCEKLYAFKMRALPFGSVRSVHSFLRVANSLWSILSSLFLVINSNYFDDFVALASKPEADSVDHTVKTVLKLLGWVFAQDGPKAPPFAADARVLGVQINVEHMGKGKIEIDNTAARRAELAEVIRQVLNDGHLPRMEALRLRGRMQFASGQLFGRMAKVWLLWPSMRTQLSRRSCLQRQWHRCTASCRWSNQTNPGWFPRALQRRGLSLQMRRMNLMATNHLEVSVQCLLMSVE